MRRTRSASPTSLAAHPHRAELDAALARIPAASDDELQTMAGLWINTPVVAKARSRALAPGTPLVVETLRIFDDLAQLFADDLDGVNSLLAANALKAVRDGLAGIIARPVLSKRETTALENPLRTALSSNRSPMFVTITPTVEQFLEAARGLADRCHDGSAAAAFERILVGAMSRDHDDHAGAVEAAFRAATSTGRHRIWSLVRVTAERGVSGRCRTCPPSLGFDDYDRERVIGLCADAACALLVADALPAGTLDLLLEPLSGLVPFPRPPLGA